jgi:hypothetical protein
MDCTHLPIVLVVSILPIAISKIGDSAEPMRVVTLLPPSLSNVKLTCRCLTCRAVRAGVTDWQVQFDSEDFPFQPHLQEPQLIQTILSRVIWTNSDSSNIVPVDRPIILGCKDYIECLNRNLISNLI